MCASVSTIVNSLGLILDIVGAFLLFLYGLPSAASDGDSYGVEESPDEQKSREKKNAFITKMARLGLGLLICGFLLQFIATWI